jgi:hypothetical protein
MKRIRLFLALWLCLACAGAQAQWQWVDKDGRKVFSDRAPPPEIPARNILKQPGAGRARRRHRGVAAPAGAEAPSGAASSAAAAPGATTRRWVRPGSPVSTRNWPTRKNRPKPLRLAKAKADEDRVQKARADNCERAKANKALMDSGVRVSHTKANGEREILDDAGRAAELKRIQIVMETNCK